MRKRTLEKKLINALPVPQVDSKVARQGKIDLGKALKYRIEKNLSYEEIGSQFGVSKQAAQQALKPFKQYISYPEAVHAFNEHKSSILNVVESELVSRLLDKKVLQKASLNNIAYALQNVNNINRLEQGKATENIDIRSVARHLTGELDRLKRQEAALMGDPGIPDVVSHPSDPDSATSHTELNQHLTG